MLGHDWRVTRYHHANCAERTWFAIGVFARKCAQKRPRWVGEFPLSQGEGTILCLSYVVIFGLSKYQPANRHKLSATPPIAAAIFLCVTVAEQRSRMMVAKFLYLQFKVQQSRFAFIAALSEAPKLSTLWSRLMQIHARFKGALLNYTYYAELEIYAGPLPRFFHHRCKNYYKGREGGHVEVNE